MKSKLLILLVIVLSLPTFLSLLRPGYFPMHDDMQVMRVHQMDKCIMDLQIPCRWVPDMGYGYGYPQFNFYSPLPYYFMELVNLLGLSIIGSVKSGFVVTIFISIIGMYLLGEKLWGRWGGALSSLLFVYAPYRAVDMYVRGAVGEFWAMSILPFVFWSILKLRNNEKHSMLYLTLSLSALFLSHNVTTLILFPFVAFFIIILSLEEYLKNKDLKIIVNFWLRTFFGLLWGVGLASFFLLPAIVEQKYAHVETLVGGYFDYRIHYVSIKQLLFSTIWGYGSSEAGPYDDFHLSTGLIHWILATVSLFALGAYRKSKKLLYAGFFTGMAFISLFMSHSRSSPIWETLSFLEIIQFPWRFLVLSTFGFSVAAGSVISLTKNKKILFSAIFIFLAIFYSSFFRPKLWLDITDREKLSGENWRLQQTISIFDYLPIYAEFPPAERAPENPQILTGDAVVTELEKHTDWTRFEVNVYERSTIQMPLFYFPDWQVYADGENIDFRYDNELGLITFELDRGEHEVLVRLENTPVRKISNILSLISIILVFVYVYKINKK